MKAGLGDSYDSVEYLPVKIRAYLDLTKPASSIGVAGGYLLASLFYFAYVEGGVNILNMGEKLFSIVYVSLTMLLAHSASQSMNMAEDAEMDGYTPHKKNRPIPSGVVTEEEARSLAWILSAFALGRGFMVNWRFGVFTTILVFMGIFYNLAPVRAKERIISIPWQAVSRGLLMFPAVWAAYGNPLAIEPWIFGVIMFLYVLAFQNTADIIDEDVDREYGISTWVVEFGLDRVHRIAQWCLVLILAVLMASTHLGYLENRFMTVAWILPVGFIMLIYMKKRPEMVSDTTGNHPAWLWYYGGMVLLVAIPLAVEMIYRK